MAPEVGVDYQRAVEPVEMIAHRGIHHATGDILVGLLERTGHRAGVGSVEVGDVGRQAGGPVLAEVIAQVQKAAILLKTHVGPMVVCPAVLRRHGTAEASLPHLVRGFGLHRAVAARPHVELGAHAIVVHPSRHDVHHAAHGIRAIEHRGGAADHLYAVGHHGLIGIADGMVEDVGILWMAIDEHQHARAAREATQVERAAATATDAIAHDATAVDEQARHLLRQCGQDALLMVLSQLLTRDHGHVHGQTAHCGGMTRPRHHHFLQCQRIGLCTGIRHCAPQGQCHNHLFLHCFVFLYHTQQGRTLRLKPPIAMEGMTMNVSDG